MDNLISRLKQRLVRWSGRQAEELRLKASIAMAARSIAGTGDHRILLPTRHTRPPLRSRAELTVGLYGNTANNFYQIAAMLRKAGVQADLILEPDGMDSHYLGWPEWEDEPCIGADEKGLSKIRQSWKRPGFVKEAPLDSESGERYQRSGWLGIREAQQWYSSRFGSPLPDDLALILTRLMRHRRTIESFAKYDVALFCGAHIHLAPFCNIPYGIFPTGGDRYVLPFREDLFGLMGRAGWRRSSAVYYIYPFYNAWHRRLGVDDRLHQASLLMDLGIYAPSDPGELRSQWEQQSGGNLFILCNCRQDWGFKGNDRVIRAFANLGLEGARLLLSEWGADLDRSRALVRELAITERVIWLPVASKPIVRQRANAAHIVIDQVAMPGFGTAAVEAMAFAKPVIMTMETEWHGGERVDPPPVHGATAEIEIIAKIRELVANGQHLKPDQKARDWVVKYRGENGIAEILGPLLEARADWDATRKSISL